MLEHTLKILSNVSALYLDPLFLVRSQAQESTGFVMVSYAREYYDLFYFHRSIIVDVTRLTSDFRYRLNLNAAISTFYERRLAPKTTVSLFRGEPDVLNRFRSTFYFEPCVKLQRDLLQPKQLAKLIAATSSTDGLLEVNSFPLDADPSFYLYQFSESNPIYPSGIRLKGPSGRVLIYDVERNRQMLKEKFTGRFEDIGSTPEKYTELIKRLESGADLISVSLLKQIPEVARVLFKKYQKQKVKQIVDRALKLTSSDEAHEGSLKANADEILSIIDSNLESGTHEVKVSDAEESDSQRQVRELFQGAFTEFCTFVRKLSPSRAHMYLQRATDSVRRAFPNFDDSNITFDTSYLLLHIAVKSIRFFKFRRHAVREHLVGLLSDLYGNHSDVLEETGTNAKIEELFRALQ